MFKSWWKILASILVLYSLIGGLLFPVPELPILHETIRNVYFHVPMWIAMFVLFLLSVVFSIRYLRSGNIKYDFIAVECVKTAMVFFILGLVSGMAWAKMTWGEAWSNDPKQTSAVIAFLLYSAYLILRNSIDDEQKSAKISSIYNIFAFPLMIVLLIILPRLTDSLHPGNGGNPAFGKYDLDNRIRMVLYPAFIGWTLIGIWIATMRYRLHLIRNEI
ncbi:cytochrome c biogenesis protein CcsA [Pedobacter sp. NJ-S-72]